MKDKKTEVGLVVLRLFISSLLLYYSLPAPDNMPPQQKALGTKK